MMNDSADTISVIVPVLNEQQNLPKLYQQLGHFSFDQIIWVDGGSDDGSWQWLEENVSEEHQIAHQTETSGRALQMNEGAKLAKSTNLLFLHADSFLPENTKEEVNQGLTQYLWGHFDIEFVEDDIRMKVVAWFMNHRSRLTSIATGDQSLFIRSESFKKVGGFPEIALMEDVEFCKNMKQFGKPYCSQSKSKTSARRWLKNGVFKTVFLMWRFRFLYARGVAPAKLAAQYRNVR